MQVITMRLLEPEYGLDVPVQFLTSNEVQILIQTIPFRFGIFTSVVYVSVKLGTVFYTKYTST